MVVMRLALFEPDIAQNAGTMMRLAACLGIAVDLIEPCGFIVGDAKFRRSAMDYLDRIDLVRHSSWAAFQAARLGRPDPGRLVLLTTRAISMRASNPTIPFWSVARAPACRTRCIRRPTSAWSCR
jgi:tRNA(Leu) C34 or U34 (ribose-2'-O)-methylase TrmL